VYPEAAEWFPEIAGFKIFRIPISPRSLKARLEPAGNAAADSNTGTIQQQVAAAMALAKRVTAATGIPAPEQKATNKERSDYSETVLREAEKAASASPNNTDPLVALVMARPEIKSVCDLTGKDIAIDDRHSASNGKVRTAIAAAGATEVQLSEGQTKAVNRLFSGEVPAAVLTFVSPEAAEWFPEITGFRIFRVPLSPRSIPIIRAPVTDGSSSASVSPPIKTSSQPIDPGPSDDLDRVIVDLDRTIQRTPEDAQAYRDRGNAWGRKGNTDRALADYQQAIRINPNDPAILHDRGLMWQRKGEFDKAIVDFDRAVRMSFSDPEIFSDRGAAWFEKGSNDRALADFNQALKINPALATAYVRRAGVFERKGDQERARADREQATHLGGPSLIQPDGRSGEVRDH